MVDLEISIRKQMVSAISEYEMLEDGDKVLVALSGGKDSAVMMKLLDTIQKKAPFSFSLHPVMLDQKQPGFDAQDFQKWMSEHGWELDLVEEDTYAIVTQNVTGGKSFCGLCSRLRRGILYNYAVAKGYTKIALGHHRDDLAETLLMNFFFNGRLSSMPPKLKSDDGRNIVIRPLCYVDESSIASLAEQWKIPIMPCNLCGSQSNLQRSKIKKMLAEMKGDYPNVGASMLRSLQNVRSSQLLDKKLWTFEF